MKRGFGEMVREAATEISGLVTKVAAQLVGAAKIPKAMLNVGIPAKTKASAKRVYNTLDANMVNVLKSNTTPNTNVWCGPNKRSVAHLAQQGPHALCEFDTCREHVASLECLRQLWDWYATEYGLPTPQCVRALLVLDFSLMMRVQPAITNAD